MRQSYRSTKEIIDFAVAQFGDNFIETYDDDEVEEEDTQLPLFKPVVPINKGFYPILVNCSSQNDLIDYIIKTINSSKQEGIPYKEMAVIYPKTKIYNSYFLEYLKKKLDLSKIPYFHADTDLKKRTLDINSEYIKI